MAALSANWLSCLLPWSRQDTNSKRRSRRAYEIAEHMHRQSGGPNRELRKLYRDYAQVQKAKGRLEKLG